MTSETMMIASDTTIGGNSEASEIACRHMFKQLSLTAEMASVVFPMAVLVSLSRAHSWMNKVSTLG